MYKVENDGEDDEKGLKDAEDDKYIEKDEENLNLSPLWSPKLIVAPDKFTDGTKGGGKTLFYKKCKVDFYPECK